MRTRTQAVDWGMTQVTHPVEDYYEKCEHFVRTALGLPAYAATAKIAASKVPANHQHTDTTDIPLGAQVFYPSLGGGTAGHVTLSIGGGKVLTNDYCTKGKICVAPWDLPNWHGKQTFAFWTFWTPQGVTPS